MSTNKQIAANRRNALRSTGPRTSEGKARSSKNALGHGLTAAKHIVLEGEDPEEFIALRDALFNDFEPQTRLEVDCLNRIAVTIWRLRRVPEFEAALITHCDLTESASNLIEIFKPQPANEEEVRRLEKGKLLKCILDDGVLLKLARYGSTLFSQLSRDYKMLKELQADRLTRRSVTVIDAGASEAEHGEADVPSIAKLDDEASSPAAGS